MVEQRSAGGLLRRARVQAGLTQAELGRRAGVTQSVVSAYESGHRQPSVPVLVDLVHAAGFAIDVELRPVHNRAGPLAGPLGRKVKRRANLIRAVAAEHGVHGVRVFGSVARGDEGPESDVDLLVEVDDGVGLFGLGRLQTRLEAVLGVPVDIVPVDGLKADVRDDVLSESVQL